MTEVYKISDLIRDTEANVLTSVFLDKEINNGYCCDMLSWAMANVTSGDAWFTILSSKNVIAVASLSDCSAVIVTEGVSMDREVLDKAIEEQICVLQTEMTTYQAASRLASALSRLE